MPEDADWRVVPFEVATGKPMIAVTLNGQPGRMLFDNGTPEAIFLNRDAASLPQGPEVGRGRAASGQEIVVTVTDAPDLAIAGLAYALPQKVPTGNFGFTAPAFGNDFMGFIGTPFAMAHAFTLDYTRQRLTFFKTGADGSLSVPPPPPSDIVAQISFAIWPGEHPTTAAILGTMPILLDFDTGDSGTIYLRPETKARLLASGAIRQDADRLILSSLDLGGATFRDITVAHVTSGGPNDFRGNGASDWLRLGADFLAQNPVLWNFPGQTLVFLKPDSAFLADRD